MRHFPFRIGTTSYIIPDDILPNARFLAGKVDDIELVLFEVDDGPNNLPDAAAIRELKSLSDRYDLTYTVHLPLDLRLTGDDGERHQSLLKARKVIDCTRSLEPFAYVLHLDGKELLNSNDVEAKASWDRQAVESLRLVGEWVGDLNLLAVENLENYPLSTWDVPISAAGVSRCVDVGHLWLNGHDPLAFLDAHIAETRVIHVHGIAERDHKSLAHVPKEELQRVFEYLKRADFRGIVTVEVFGEEDFQSSMQAVDGIAE